MLSACVSAPLDYESSTHTVRSGETLYTIAWRYGVDYRTLARWNSLSDPDRIFPGQQLRLRGPGGTRAVAATRTTAERPRAAPPPSPVAEPEPAWIWPTQGRIAAGFGSADGIGAGIAVAGTSGQAVRAASGGRVVYIGTGLAGYGQLIIIKHSDTWLSAYGHTDEVLVGQGDSVSSGQRIAAMGLGPRRQPRLHFEIRRNGSPVDPLALLPAQR
jgi:lipoprotein NlpD